MAEKNQPEPSPLARQPRAGQSRQVRRSKALRTPPVGQEVTAEEGGKLRRPAQSRQQRAKQASAETIAAVPKVQVARAAQQRQNADRKSLFPAPAAGAELRLPKVAVARVAQSGQKAVTRTVRGDAS